MDATWFPIAIAILGLAIAGFFGLRAHLAEKRDQQERARRKLRRHMRERFGP